MDGYQTVQEKDKKRFEVLKFIYEDTNGEKNKLSVAEEISQTIGISKQELIPILQYLEAEGLIKPLSSLYSDSVVIRLLHPGVREVESAIKRPNEPTEHFPAQIFNITNNAPIGGQQFGNNNTLNVNHQDLVEAATQIRQLLDQLQQDYSTETFVEQAVVAEQAVQRIESNPTLKTKVIGALKSAGKEAFKEAINHPLVNVFVAAIEGWQDG